MTWNLFLDDERFPPNDGREWVIARNGMEATYAIAERGCYPSYISFDHDLGDEDDGETGYDYAKRLVEMDMDTDFPKYKFSDDFSFYVHSQNPIGKANIEGLLNNYLKVKDDAHQGTEDF